MRCLWIVIQAFLLRHENHVLRRYSAIHIRLKWHQVLRFLFYDSPRGANSRINGCEYFECISKDKFDYSYMLVTKIMVSAGSSFESRSWSWVDTLMSISFLFLTFLNWDFHFEFTEIYSNTLRIRYDIDEHWSVWPNHRKDKSKKIAVKHAFEYSDVCL